MKVLRLETCNNRPFLWMCALLFPGMAHELTLRFRKAGSDSRLWFRKGLDDYSQLEKHCTTGWKLWCGVLHTSKNGHTGMQDSVTCKSTVHAENSYKVSWPSPQSPNVQPVKSSCHCPSSWSPQSLKDRTFRILGVQTKGWQARAPKWNKLAKCFVLF